MTVQKKKKYYLNCFWEAKLYNCIREDNEETSFSCNVSVCVRVLHMVCGGMGVSTGIVGPLWHVFTEKSKERFGTEECVYVCLLLVGMAEMCKCWAAVSGTLRHLQEGFWCTRFSLTWNIWLPMESSRKGNPLFYLGCWTTHTPCLFSSLN